MVTTALLWWLGQQVQAPTWYFEAVAALFVIRLLEFVCAILAKLTD